MKYRGYREYAEHVGTLVVGGPSWPPTTRFPLTTVNNRRPLFFREKHGKLLNT